MGYCIQVLDECKLHMLYARSIYW